MSIENRRREEAEAARFSSSELGVRVGLGVLCPPLTLTLLVELTLTLQLRFAKFSAAAAAFLAPLLRRHIGRRALRRVGRIVGHRFRRIASLIRSTISGSK